MQHSTNNEENKSTGYKTHYKPLLIILIVVAALAALAFVNRNNIFDWWKLRGYKAPTAITSLSSQDTMTPYALKLFEINHPNIENKTAFAKQCPNDGGEKTIVLGCYHSGESGIYLLSVSDPLLKGVEQVTAAHEMLHAAYARLSSGERKNVDTMLLNYYNNDLKDPRIKNTIAAYKKTEPNDVVNEMHSVFGTEVANLPVPLEQYYTRYFTDRQKVTSYAAQYEAAFTSRQDVVTTDDNQLKTIKPEIDSMETSIKSQLSVINAEQAQLNTYKTKNDTKDYNSEVTDYNSKVTTYNEDVFNLKTLINTYNTIVNSSNQLAVQENHLGDELNSSVKTVN
jgi:hypothetical protein